MDVKRRSPVVAWNPVIGKFESAYEEEPEVSGRVLLQIDDEPTARIEVQFDSEGRQLLRNRGSALRLQWNWWVDFRHRLADLLERFSAWIRP